jgi:hypothetical protein
MSAPIDFDGPWKAALEELLEPCFALLFPTAYREIDWLVPPRFLDKELQQVFPGSGDAPRAVDKLLEVRLHSSDAPAWVLVHIEVQSQEQRTFAARMFEYHTRLWLHHRRQIVSLAVLGDERAAWRPQEFGYSLWGCELLLRFPIAKLHDYRARLSELEASRNPFATVVLAHLLAQDTRGDAPARAAVKLSLTRRLYRLGYGRAEIIRLYRFIDWLLQLPADLEAQTLQQIKAFEEEEAMNYMSYAERVGHEAGLQEGLSAGRAAGLLEGIGLALDVKFPDVSVALLAEIRQLSDLAQLEAVARAIRIATTPDEVRQSYGTLGDDQ